PGADPASAGAEDRDPAVRVVRHEDVPRRVRRGVAWLVQLADPGARAFADRADQAAGGRIHPDLVPGGLRDEYHVVARAVDARADPHDRSEPDRPDAQRI